MISCSSNFNYKKWQLINEDDRKIGKLMKLSFYIRAIKTESRRHVAVIREDLFYVINHESLSNVFIIVQRSRRHKMEDE